MNCLDFHNLLQQRLDGESIPSHAELHSHLAECSACRQLEASARQLEEGIRLLPRPVPPADFSDRVVAEVLAEYRAQHRWPPRTIWVAALAASLVLAILAGWQWWPSSTPAPSPDPAPLAKGPETPVSATPRLSDSVAEVGSALEGLARRTTDEAVEPTLLLWGEPAVEVEPAPADDPTLVLWEAGQTVGSGLEPMTTSALRAFDLFRRDLSPMTGELRNN
jgi:hypothetical protein